jgi:polysaccharide export outer membrane protein
MIKQFDTNKFIGNTSKIIDQLNSVKDYIVGPDGKIAYPFVGRIQAVGLSVSQLEKKIAEALARYVESPQVAIGMKKFSGEKIIILGEVAYPGIYTYKGALNLIEAIALAGDVNEKAHLDSVIVVHGNLSGNPPQVRRVNMTRAITRGTDKDDIVLQPNDVVYVPRTFVGNFTQFVNDIGPLINNASTAIDVRTKVRAIQGYKR